MEQIEAFLRDALGSLNAVPGVEVAGSVALFLTTVVAVISKYAIAVYILGKMMRAPKFEPKKIVALIVIGAVTPVVFSILADLGSYVSLGLWSGALIGSPWYLFLRPRLIRRYAKRAARKAGRTVAKLR